MTSLKSTGKKATEPRHEPGLKSAALISEAEALKVECGISTNRELGSTSELF